MTTWLAKPYRDGDPLGAFIIDAPSFDVANKRAGVIADVECPEWSALRIFETDSRHELPGKCIVGGCHGVWCDPVSRYCQRHYAESQILREQIAAIYDQLADHVPRRRDRKVRAAYRLCADVARGMTVSFH